MCPSVMFLAKVPHIPLCHPMYRYNFHFETRDNLVCHVCFRSYSRFPFQKNSPNLIYIWYIYIILTIDLLKMFLSIVIYTTISETCLNTFQSNHRSVWTFRGVSKVLQRWNLMTRSRGNFQRNFFAVTLEISPMQ